MAPSRRRQPVSRSKLALGVVVVWGILLVAFRLGLSPMGILLLVLVIFEVSSMLWACDSRDGRDWPKRGEWGRWKRTPGPSVRRSPERG